jgi:copper chaperone CopZ
MASGSRSNVRLGDAATIDGLLTAIEHAGYHAQPVVEAAAETKIITFTYDPMQADLPKIEEALEEEGYPVEK